MTLSYKIEICRSAKQFAEHGDSWDALVSRSLVRVPHCRHIWISSWIDSYWRDQPLTFLLIWNNKTLIAAAPLVIDSIRFYGISCKRLRFASGGATASNSFLVDPAHPRGTILLLNELRKLHKTWDLAELSNFPVSLFKTMGISKALHETTLDFLLSPARVSPYLPVTGSFSGYLADQSKNFRYDAKRCSRNLAKAGNVVIRLFEKQHSICRHLDEAFSVSEASWKGPAKSDMAGKSESEIFFRAICSSTDPNCQPLLWILYLDEVPIAIQFYVSDGATIHLLRSDFDTQYSSLRPGVYLQNEIIKQCFALEFAELDFGGMDYSYKMRYTKLTRPHWQIDFFGRRLFSQTLYNLKRLKRRVNQTRSALNKLVTAN